MVSQDLCLSADAPREGVVLVFPVAVVGEGDDARFEQVTCMLMIDAGAEHVCLAGRRVEVVIARVAGRRAVRRTVGQHIFAGDVEGLALVGIVAAEVKTVFDDR